MLSKKLNGLRAKMNGTFLRLVESKSMLVKRKLLQSLDLCSVFLIKNCSVLSIQNCSDFLNESNGIFVIWSKV